MYLYDVINIKKSSSSLTATKLAQLWAAKNAARNSSHIYNNTQNSQNVNISNQKSSKNSQNNTNVIQYSLPDTDSEGRKLTEAQREYFADSKVVDKDGRLVPVSHGTDAEFTVFEKKYVGTGFSNGINNLGDGFYFTDSTDDNVYAELASHNKVVYLDIRNPYYLGAKDNKSQWQKLIENSGLKYDPKKNWSSPTSTFAALREITGLNGERLKSTFTRLLQEQGYDGIIEIGGYSNDYVVFNSNQIKNVDNLSPTDNDDIRYSLSEINGKKVVVVDTDQDIFEGKDKHEIRETARDYIKERYQGKEIEGIKFTNDSTKEYVYSKYSKKLISRDEEQFTAKMKASTELEAFIESGEFVRHEEAKHSHSYNKGGYNRYKVRFIVDDMLFAGEMVVAIGSDGQGMFYDIVKIKEGKDPRNGQTNATADRDLASSNKDYTQKTKKVKGFNENNTNETKFSLPDDKKVYTKASAKRIFNDIVESELRDKYHLSYEGKKGLSTELIHEVFNNTTEGKKLQAATDIAEYFVQRAVFEDAEFDEVDGEVLNVNYFKTAAKELFSDGEYRNIVENVANKLVEAYDANGKKDALTRERDLTRVLKEQIKELKGQVKTVALEKNVSMQIQHMTQSAKEFAKRKYSSQAFSGEEAMAVNDAFSKVVVGTQINTANAIHAVAVAKNFYTPERINGKCYNTFDN